MLVEGPDRGLVGLDSAQGGLELGKLSGGGGLLRRGIVQRCGRRMEEERHRGVDRALMAGSRGDGLPGAGDLGRGHSG